MNTFANGTAEFGTRDDRARSAFRLPPSTFHLGITLTEVLISLGILTLGLLGVAALFPVGGFYMLKADVADHGSALGNSVMNDLVTRGMLNPWAWYVMVPTPSNNTANSPNYVFPGVDGKYASVASTSASATFTRPYGEALAQGRVLNIDPVVLSKQFGSAYIIDPTYIATVATANASSTNYAVAYPFPATAIRAFPGTGWKYYSTSGWNPWRANAAPMPTSGTPTELTWPIRRVTFQGPDGWHIKSRLAEYYFRGNDDLSTDLPSRDDLPANQKWDMAGSTPLARQWAGDYSWIVSVVPTTNAARDGAANSPQSHAYDVSVVVFYKRLLPTDTASIPTTASTERMVSAAVVSSGLTGGELLLKDFGDYVRAGSNINDSPFDQLRSGQWIMLCGPHPDSTMSEPRFVLNWYQVLSIDIQGNSIPNFDPAKQRVVAVRGPQWPWQPAPGGLGDYNHLSNDLCVAICPGAVAVHTKTLRLDSGSGPWGAGMSLFVPPNVSNPVGSPGTELEFAL